MREILVLSFVLVLALLGVARAEEAPEQLVQATADTILADIKKNRELYAKDHARLYKMAEDKVLPHFDFRRMSQWVLGRAWRDATPEQRDRFTAAFRDHLVATYATALLNYKDQEVIYLPVQAAPGADDVVVRTEIKQGGGQPNIPIYYSFYKNREGAWKVYDISIEGVSLVTNYRSVYVSKIREQGIDALIDEIVNNTRQKRLAGSGKS
jgi:phospholipid transport system substrate-binding protein